MRQRSVIISSLAGELVSSNCRSFEEKTEVKLELKRFAIYIESSAGVLTKSWSAAEPLTVAMET